MSDTTAPGTWEAKQAQHRAAAEVIGVDWSTRTPTPDDMLAWLQQHVIDDNWNTEGAVIIMTNPGDVEINWYCAAGVDGVQAPTLHAALERAVIAVGRAE